ncbi:CLUMA_CG014189, isoform A [Clunio marinus]|uniref:CLUMA_CG014189, isoform A n=1 Tax=Clunio marinus TaxID=568069 RepID=A0A1J1IMW4_9DIPT|nr:CLUMA_CG014189, isoform A [Clunio marinus]
MEIFSIQRNSEFGRFAIACQDLNAGEFLSEDFPFVIGPKASTTCCCLECYCPVDATSSGSRCDDCSWPLCHDCRKLSERPSHKRECEIFKAAKCKFYNLSVTNAICMQLDCITPLRVLLEKEFNSMRWHEEIEPMEHHRNERFGSPTWNADEQNVVGYLCGPCKMKQRGIDGELIQQVIGILEVNTFEGKTVKSHTMRCLYPKLSILSHSCTPNTTHSIHPSYGNKFTLRATIPIKQGSQLYTTYAYTLSGTAERQQHLKQGKFFQCHCERCLDPTELGTNFSSLKCQKCHLGYLLASDPLNSETIWKCNKCECEVTTVNIQSLLKTLQDEINSTRSIESLENLLEKYKTILHSNHFLMISIKNLLIDLYGHVRGYLLSELPESLLRRKIQLCTEVLQILDVFESGKSRARGLMLIELHQPITLHASCQYKLGKISNKEYLIELEKSQNILNESLEILSCEDESICQQRKLGKLSLNQLEKLIKDVKENCN